MPEEVDIFNLEERQKKLTEVQKRARQKEIEDVKKILKTPEGRRDYWRRMGKCGILRSSFTPNSNQTAFNEGRRDVGLEILRDINEADGSAFAQMQNEYVSALKSKKEAQDGRETKPADQTQKPADTQDPSLIKEAGGTGTLLNQAADTQTDEQKQAQAAEETRLLETDVNTLSEEDKGKRTVIEKAREDKRLLDTPDDQLSEEDKPKKAELVKAKDAEAKAKEVPEKYEFKMPEGITLNQALADKVSPIFKEMKLSQGDAQKLVDFYIENQKAESDAQATSFKQFLKESYDETVKGLGATYKEQLAYVAKVRDRFLSEETQEMLDASGLSNNKAFILDLIKLGKLISEDKLPPGTPAAPTGSKSVADTLYPDQGKK